MDKKIIFFDVDGTFVTFDQINERVLPSTIEAVRKTREKGNLVYLCTGRSKAEIFDHIMDVGIDGVIGAGGGYAEIGEEMLFHKKFSAEDVKHFVDFFEANNYDYYLESNGGLFASKNLVRRLKFLKYGDIDNDSKAQELEKKGDHFIDCLIEGANMYREDVNKACFFENKDISFDIIENEFKNNFTVHHCTVPMFGDDSGELSVPNVNKSTAIEAVINHLNIDKKNTFAFGDGLNDIEMLEYCEVGIAMGNAKDGLKAVADYVTDDDNKDGIYNAMKKYDLI